MYGTQIAKWGDSLVVRIPEKILSDTGIVEGDDVEVTAVAGSIIIRKRPDGDKTLKSAGMLAGSSNPELRKPEKGAWKKAAVEKYGSR